jgi:hypothetical protein
VPRTQSIKDIAEDALDEIYANSILQCDALLTPSFRRKRKEGTVWVEKRELFG